jgi:hypothetical protein
MTQVTNLTACSWGEGRIDVFGVDPATGNVQQLIFEDGRWQTNLISNPFQGLGTQFQGYITACSWGDQRIDIFGADSAGQLLHFYYGGVVLNSWTQESLGKQGLTGQVTACAWGENRIDIFGLNTARDRMIQYYFDGKWEGPVSHDYTNIFRISTFNQFAQGITCASWGPGRIDIFGQDSTGKMEQIYFDSGWHGAILEPTTSPTTAAISSCAPDDNSVDTFWIDSNGDIQHYYYDGAWRPQKKIDNPFPGKNWTLQTASSWRKGRIDLFGMDEAGTWLHVAHGWVPEDLP